RARRWVETHHTWSAAAREALAGLEASQQSSRTRPERSTEQEPSPRLQSGGLPPDQLQWAQSAIQTFRGKDATVISVQRVPSRVGDVHRLITNTVDSRQIF